MLDMLELWCYVQYKGIKFQVVEANDGQVNMGGKIEFEMSKDILQVAWITV